MRQLELDNFGFVEINSDELIELEGGWWQLAVGAVVAGIIADWDDFKAGLSGGCQKK